MRERAWLFRTAEKYFDILSRLRVDYECDKQTDRRTDRQTDRHSDSKCRA